VRIFIEFEKANRGLGLSINEMQHSLETYLPQQLSENDYSDISNAVSELMVNFNGRFLVKLWVVCDNKSKADAID